MFNEKDAEILNEIFERYDKIYKKLVGLDNKKYYLSFSLNRWLKQSRDAGEIFKPNNEKQLAQTLDALGFHQYKDIHQEGIIYAHKELHKTLNDWAQSKQKILFIDKSHVIWNFKWNSFFPTWNNFNNPLIEEICIKEGWDDILARLTSEIERGQLEKWPNIDINNLPIRSANQYILIEMDHLTDSIIEKLSSFKNKVGRPTSFIIKSSKKIDECDLKSSRQKVFNLKHIEPFILNPKSKQLEGEWVSYRCRSSGELSEGHHIHFRIHDDGHIYIHYEDEKANKKRSLITFDSDGFIHFQLINLNENDDETESTCIFENINIEDPLVLCGSYSGVSRSEPNKIEKRVFSAQRILFNKDSIKKLQWIEEGKTDEVITKCAQMWHYETMKSFTLKPSFKVKPRNNISPDKLKKWFEMSPTPLEEKETLHYTGYASYNKDNICLIKLTLQSNITYFDISLSFEKHEYVGEGFFKSDRYLVAHLKQVTGSFKKNLSLLLEYREGSKYEFQGILMGLGITRVNTIALGMVATQGKIEKSKLDSWENVDSELKGLKEMHLNTVKKFRGSN